MIGDHMQGTAFIRSYRGFTIRAYYRPGPNATIIIKDQGAPFREFEYPAYRIWNLSAHFGEMIDHYLDVEAEDFPA